MALIETSLNQLSSAEVHLKKAMQIDPQNQQYYIDLARFYEQTKRDVEAQEILREEIKKKPAAIPLYIELTTILSNDGRHDEAEGVIERLRLQSPTSPDVASAIGDFYAQNKEFDSALAEEKRGMSISPNNTQIQKRLEDLYLMTNKAAMAGSLDQDLMKKAPGDLFVRIAHGRLLLAEGRIQESILYLEKVVADAPDSAEARYFLTDDYWRNQELDRARGSAQEALKLSPSSRQILEQLVRIDLAESKPADARYYVQKLVDQYSSDSETHELLGQTLARLGQFDKAAVELSAAEKLSPDDPIIRLNLAQVLSTEKRMSDAESEFETAARLGPHNSTIVARWADFLLAQKQTEQALTQVKHYVLSNPIDPYGYIVEGWLYFEIKDYGSARSALEHAIALDPRNLQANLELASVYRAQGQIDAAVQSYQQAVVKEPRSAALQTIVGNLYLEKNELETARRYYLQALSIDSNYAIANANLAWVDAIENTDLDVALGMARKAKSLLPDETSITDTLGWVMYKKGNYSGALPLFHECVDEAPTSANYHYHLGLALLAAGQKNQGRNQLQSALNLRLDGNDAQEARRALVQSN
jgi:Flp pilus assembly protein TadD